LYTVYSKINGSARSRPFRVPVDATIPEFLRSDYAAERFFARISTYGPLSCSRPRNGRAMKIAGPREFREGERRIAPVPKSCRKLVKAGIEVSI
jgi:hypothetical protein